MMQDVHVKLYPGSPWQKQHLTRRRLFNQRIGFRLRENVVKVLHLEHNWYGAETWTLRKVDQKYLQRFFECGVGEEWRSVGSIV